MTPTNTCLDAETLAAWVDGGLDPAAAAMAEAHVSSCDRCQSILGVMAKTEPLPMPAEAPWWSRFRAGWLIPLTAAIAAVGLWMIVPTERQAAIPPAQQPKSTVARDQAPAAAAERPAEASSALESKRQQPAPQAIDQLAKKTDQDDPNKNKEAKLEARAREERFDEKASAARPAAPAAAPAAAQAFGRLNDASPREIASPDARTRWRLLDAGNVEYTANGGETWEVIPTGVTDQLVAGSSPTSDVCWIVGKNGIVLLTTDGRRWQRLAFPETMDLARVQAIDSRSALVIAEDGMLFRTLDAGATWSRP